MPALPQPAHRIGATHTIDNLQLIDHWFTLPATHGLKFSHGDDAAQQHRYARHSITVFAREVINTAAHLTTPAEQRPYLLYLQGGPGGASPRPATESGWIAEISTTHRVILLDQRGTGNSTPLTHSVIGTLGTLKEQIDYLELFRADSIIADAEAIRILLLAGQTNQRWSTLGQSFGGFLTLSYLSFAPEALTNCRITAGLAPIRAHIDDVYRHTYTRTKERNEQYYSWYPEDREHAGTIANFLRENTVHLPTGEQLTDHRFQMLGHYLGGNGRVHGLHYVLESAFAEGKNHLSARFLDSINHVVSYAPNPLYALLHESIYADGPTGSDSPSPAPTNWSAARIAQEFPEFSPTAQTPLFTGEHIFPWFFTEDPALAPLHDLAHALAEKKDWGRLYDHEQLARNDVPVAAAAYEPDIFVDYEHSMKTAAHVGNVHVWSSPTHHHDGLGVDGTLILRHLTNLLAN